MEQALTILYTANLRGDLDRLPHLYTFLRRLQQEIDGHVLLMDAGNACDAAIWHCDVTGGRSMLLVLDAMGYAAVNAGGFLSAEGRARLTDNHLTMAVLFEDEQWESGGVLVSTRDAPATSPDRLHVILNCAEATSLDGYRLHLAAIDAGQVGIVGIGSSGEDGRLSITRQAVLTLPPASLPDPTIAATVAFVLSEARYYQRRRGDSGAG